MNIRVPIDGIEAKTDKSNLVVCAEEEMKTLSSSVLGGGFARTRYILNHHVEKDFNHDSPGSYLKKISLTLGIRGKVIGMMTAADLRNLTLKKASRGDLKVCALVTGGISNAAGVGEKATYPSPQPGTINIILLIDGRLTEAAMVGTIITITEAKSFALRELDIKSAKNERDATGTSTDAVVIACTERGGVINYAGTGTVLGELIGRTVLRAAKEAIVKQEGW
jgi:iron complex transport system ATP-binding protein